MFRFEDPIYLWLLLLVPVLLLLRFITYKRRMAKLKKFGDMSLVTELMPDVSKYRPTVKFMLILAALALVSPRYPPGAREASFISKITFSRKAALASVS